MKVYIVREFFISSQLGPKFICEYIPNHLVAYLTADEVKKLDEIEYSTRYDLFNYGLIFYSTEYPFPETVPEESYDEMVCRLLDEVKDCGNPDCECKK